MSWVKGKNGIRRIPGPRPANDPEGFELTGMDLTMERAVETLMATLERNFAATPATVAVARDLCGDCGCLLAPGERCPACLVWAEVDATRWSWQAAA